MVSQENAPKGLAWQVTVPDGSSVKTEQKCWCPISMAWSGFLGMIFSIRSNLSRFAKRIWNIGVDDPRRVIHCVKVGLALTLVSVFYYTRPLYDGVGGTAMWAIMTVVVIFEFTVGGSLYKGLNRATATLSAGVLAFGIHWLASKSGETSEHIILGAAAFILSSAATFSRFIPNIKAKFDYGITIFILTFNLVAVSGYRVDNLLSLVQKRVSTIAIGISICLIVCVVVFPVWAGEDLHLLVARNMGKLADSLEGSVAEYFNEGETNPDAKKASCQKLQGYKCILNSKASEDSLANLARWEPSHGRFGFRHPWSQYLKIGAALRHCTYCVETLNGCIHSDVQAPECIKKHIREVCIRLSMESSKVLKECANSTKSMKKPSSIGFLLAEMNDAVEEIHTSLKTLPTTTEEIADQEKKHLISTVSTVQLMEALPIITVTSLLIEISTRIEAVVDAVEDLADLAGFVTDDDEEPEEIKHVDNHSTSIGPRGVEQV